MHRLATSNRQHLVILRSAATKNLAPASQRLDSSPPLRCGSQLRHQWNWTVYSAWSDCVAVHRPTIHNISQAPLVTSQQAVRFPWWTRFGLPGRRTQHPDLIRKRSSISERKVPPSLLAYRSTSALTRSTRTSPTGALPAGSGEIRGLQRACLDKAHALYWSYVFSGSPCLRTGYPGYKTGGGCPVVNREGSLFRASSAAY